MSILGSINVYGPWHLLGITNITIPELQTFIFVRYYPAISRRYTEKVNIYDSPINNIIYLYIYTYIYIVEL